MSEEILVSGRLVRESRVMQDDPVQIAMRFPGQQVQITNKEHAELRPKALRKEHGGDWFLSRDRGNSDEMTYWLMYVQPVEEPEPDGDPGPLENEG